MRFQVNRLLEGHLAYKNLHTSRLWIKGQPNNAGLCGNDMLSGDVHELFSFRTLTVLIRDKKITIQLVMKTCCRYAQSFFLGEVIQPR